MVAILFKSSPSWIVYVAKDSPEHVVLAVF